MRAANESYALKMNIIVILEVEILRIASERNRGIRIDFYPFPQFHPDKSPSFERDLNEENIYITWLL